MLAAVDFATQLLLVLLGFDLVFSPHILVVNVHWGVAPTWVTSLLAIPVGDDRVHGHRDRLQPRRGGARPRAEHPALDLMVAVAVFAIYFTLPAIALSALPVHQVDGALETLLGPAAAEGGFANDPVLGVVENLGLTGTLLDGSRSTWASSRRRSSSSRRTPA